MSSEEELQAEVETLRHQVEQHRLSELSALRESLAEARADAAHFRQEAQRNADVGRQIAVEAQQELARLRERVQTLEQLPNARSTTRVGG